MMTSEKSGYENSGFKLLWQMLCVWLTAGQMWICYILLKGFGWTTERNATSLPCPGKRPCSAVGQAVICGEGRWQVTFSLKILGRGEYCRQEHVVSRGNILLWQSRRPSTEQKVRHAARCFSQMPRGDWQGWMHLKKLVWHSRTKPRPEGKALSIMT